MKTFAPELFVIFQDIISKMGFLLLGITKCSMRGKPVIRVVVDNCEQDGRITLENCCKILKRLKPILLVDADSRYASFELEVTSPGPNRQIFNLEQFSKYFGNNVQVKLKLCKNIGNNSGINCKTIVGKVIGTTDSFVLLLDPSGNKHELDIADIVAAKLLDF